MTCPACKVDSNQGEGRSPLWTRQAGDGRLYCVPCAKDRVRRAAEGEAALLGMRQHEVRRYVRAALADFERRRKEELQDRMPAPAPKPKPEPAPTPPRFASYPERYPKVAAELRRNPRRANPEIVTAAGLLDRSLGSARVIVSRVRHDLEAAGEIERYRATGGRRWHRSVRRAA